MFVATDKIPSRNLAARTRMNLDQADLSPKAPSTLSNSGSSLHHPHDVSSEIVDQGQGKLRRLAGLVCSGPYL